ncbi:MAG: phage head-tail connector protein [Clostridia bacterium]|nr:phage head-tail connector protein [Clostridia bacterium]
MTSQEKKVRLAVLISPDTASDELLDALLSQSEGIVLNKRYPFGIPEGSTVPTQYEHVQLQIAVELFAKMGAEGQTGHNENGVNRTYEAADVSPSLLWRIVPVCGSVM